MSEARAALDRMTSYQVLMHRQEHVNGELQPEEDVVLAIRREPRAVRLSWPIGPHKGREVLYRADEPGGLMHVNMADSALPIPRLSIPPDSPMVMKNSRHPVTEAGFDSLIRGLEDAPGRRLGAQLRRPRDPAPARPSSTIAWSGPRARARSHGSTSTRKPDSRRSSRSRPPEGNCWNAMSSATSVANPPELAAAEASTPTPVGPAAWPLQSDRRGDPTRPPIRRRDNCHSGEAEAEVGRKHSKPAGLGSPQSHWNYGLTESARLAASWP